MIHFVSEEQTCQLAMINKAGVNRAHDSEYSSAVIAVVQKTSTSLFSQICYHKLRQK